MSRPPEGRKSLCIERYPVRPLKFSDSDLEKIQAYLFELMVSPDQPIQALTGVRVRTQLRDSLS